MGGQALGKAACGEEAVGEAEGYQCVRVHVFLVPALQTCPPPRLAGMSTEFLLVCFGNDRKVAG